MKCKKFIGIGVVMTSLVALLLCTGCSKRIYVPVERISTRYMEADTTTIYNRLRAFMESQKEMERSQDSIMDHQKERLVLAENGDTMRHEYVRTIYRSSRQELELQKTVQQRDSLIAILRRQLSEIKSDTVPVVSPAASLKEPGIWQKFKMMSTGIIIGIVATLVFSFLYRINKRKKITL